VGGASWMTNDAVNVVSGVVGAVAALVVSRALA
jgi:uncharacterized membrane protein